LLFVTLVANKAIKVQASEVVIRI